MSGGIMQPRPPEDREREPNGCDRCKWKSWETYAWVSVAYVAVIVLCLILAGRSHAATTARPPAVIDRAIRHAAKQWHVSYTLLRRRANCESGYRPRAVNPATVAGEHATGLFQFLPSTWRTTPYAHHWIKSGWWNAHAAAWMQHVGRGGEWACR